MNSDIVIAFGNRFWMLYRCLDSEALVIICAGYAMLTIRAVGIPLRVVVRPDVTGEAYSGSGLGVPLR